MTWRRRSADMMKEIGRHHRSILVRAAALSAAQAQITPELLAKQQLDIGLIIDHEDESVTVNLRGRSWKSRFEEEQF
jgi:hypothetical protein